MQIQELHWNTEGVQLWTQKAALRHVALSILREELGLRVWIKAVDMWKVPGGLQGGLNRRVQNSTKGPKVFVVHLPI